MVIHGNKVKASITYKEEVFRLLSAKQRGRNRVASYEKLKQIHIHGSVSVPG
ncbi:hypothetical protein [Halobacillus sp. Marseille-P3879]|uniref:hypothetical protein n=1 Tax=Halobacillus sp. Marseille-P3879 TaxID=2045014 RepID=UPI0013595CEE|nr:hypothetical protein [Halobacillus sp. Marseille-P3879]